MATIARIRNWWNSSLRHRVLASSVITITISLIVLGYLSLRTAQLSLANDVYQRNSQLASLLAVDINGDFDNVWGNLTLFAYELETYPLMLPLQARAMLELRRTAPLTYRALYLLDAWGNMRMHMAEPLEELLEVEDIYEIVNRPAIPTTDEIRQAYQGASQGELFVSDAYLVGVDRIPVVYVGIPVGMETKKPYQIIVAEIDLRDIWRKVDGVHIGQTGQAFTVSRSGMIIAHPDRRYIGESIPAALNPVLNGNQGQVDYVDPGDGQRKLASYSPAGGKSGWGVVVEQNWDESLAPVNNIGFITVVIVLLASLIATAASALVARGITRPLEHLARATRKISETGDLSQTVAVTQQDEVGQVAATFNQMIVGLDKARRDIQKMNQKLEQRVTRRTAELNTANEELQAFAYVVSHDLKAPLRGISQLANWISTDYASVLDPEGQDMLELLLARTHRMNDLIEGILQYSRIGRVRGEVERVDLNRLAQETVDLLGPSDSIRVTINNELPVVMGERVRFEQVFQNLLSNAIKFMDKSPGQIAIASTDGNSQWTISVTDNGPGIEERYFSKIFQMFQTLQPRDQFESTGVGLALVKRIVEDWGGQIWLESTPGQGTVFYFTVPMKEAVSERQQAHPFG